MKTILFAAIILAALCLSVFGAPPEKLTLTLRFQPPEAANASECYFDKAEVEKACKLLRSKLRQSGMDVQLGTFSRGEGAGQLWIDGKPLETWLASAKPCRVSALEIVEAGLAAAEKLQRSHDEARRSAGGSSAPAGTVTAPVR